MFLKSWSKILFCMCSLFFKCCACFSMFTWKVGYVSQREHTSDWNQCSWSSILIMSLCKSSDFVKFFRLSDPKFPLSVQFISICLTSSRFNQWIKMLNILKKFLIIFNFGNWSMLMRKKLGLWVTTFLALSGIVNNCLTNICWVKKNLYKWWLYKSLS